MPSNEPGQVRQRVTVAFTGLAIVLALIGLAGLILNTVGRNHPADGASASGAATRATANSSDSSEPLAELGVTPSTQSNSTLAGSTAR
jgi:hypothetical protein